VEQTSHAGERMWTVGEVASYLRMSKPRVRKWVHDRQLPAHRLPGSTRFWFDPQVVRAFARGQLSIPVADVAKSA
jgi:excisionase family DNA binding protein